MKSYFENIDVECWENDEKLGRASPSLCLYHRSSELGQSIVPALDELQMEGSPSRRTLTFKRSQRKHFILTLRLHLVPKSDAIRVMSIACEKDSASIELTSLGLELMRNAVLDWCKGSEDFRVCPSHSELKRREFGTKDLSVFP